MWLDLNGLAVLFGTLLCLAGDKPHLAGGRAKHAIALWYLLSVYCFRILNLGLYVTNQSHRCQQLLRLTVLCKSCLLEPIKLYLNSAETPQL